MERREPKPAAPGKIIVLLAFDKGEDGELLPAFEAREMRDESTAIRTAKDLARRHVGVLTWSRTADLVNGEFGEPVVLFQHGDVPDME
jgi:hypothetical protein